MKRFVMGMSGASGQAVGLRVLGELLRHAEVHLVMSRTAMDILAEEAGVDLRADSIEETGRRAREHFESDVLNCWAIDDLRAPFSSGSYETDGMIVAPCSMKTLAGIAGGYAGSLIERAADVTIKEGRPLVLSPREMPFSAIHLENMLKLARLGVRIAPPVPAFYHGPKGLEDMVDFMAGKLLDAMGVSHRLFRRWGQ